MCARTAATQRSNSGLASKVAMVKSYMQRRYGTHFAHLFLFTIKSSQVNTLLKAKSQAKDKRAKDRQKHAALRCKVGGSFGF